VLGWNDLHSLVFVHPIKKNLLLVMQNVQEAERPSEGFYIRSGITVVLKNAVIPNGTTI
jgi:glucose-1-phosphate adenylyltransferase